MRMSLRTKLIGFGLLFALLPLLVAMLPSIRHFESIQKNSVLDRERLVAESASQEIGHFLELQFRSLREAELFFSEAIEDERRRELLVESILFSNDSFVEVAVTDLEGQEIVRKHRYQAIQNDDLQDRSQTEAFQALDQKDFYLSDLYFQQGRPFFTIGLVVRDSQEEKQGTLLAEVDARTMQQVVRETSVAKEGGRAYVVNDEGTVIAHPNISVVLSKTDFSSVPIVQSIQGDPVNGFTEEYVDEEGNEVLGSWSDLTISLSNSDIATGWYVVSEESATQALSSVREMRWFALGALVIVVLLVIPSVLLISKQIITPIRKVHQFAKRVEEGDYSQKVSVKVRDEIGELASGMNEMAESIEQARERDALVSKMKADFLSIAAHQLRTPLSAIKWTFQMLMSGDIGKINSQQEKFVKRGHETSERIIKLVNDLLNASQIEEGKFDYEFKEVSLRKITKEAIKGEKAQADKKDITVTFHKPDTQLPPIKADDEKINLVVSNLIDNAIKYTSDGGKVDIYLEDRGENQLFKITDNGIGIPKEEQGSRLFTKFFRGERAKRLHTDGSGLGLFLVKNIVESHDGELWVESAEGEGTTFFFTVPTAS